MRKKELCTAVECQRRESNSRRDAASDYRTDEPTQARDDERIRETKRETER